MKLNPFNILNIYADCSAKELAASKARLTAFTSVGKVVKDLVVSASGEKQHNITTAQIQAAYNTLQQPSNKISYALLWFFKPKVDDLRELLEHGTVSEIACGFENYYDRLDDKSPKPLWLLQDLTTINLLSENCVKALTFAYEIFPRTQEWLDSIGCETLRMSSQEIEMLFTALLEETGHKIEKSQLYHSLIERYLKELTGNSFELHVLSEKVLLLEKNYSYVETYTEKAQMESWSDRLAIEAMRIINENFPFWTKLFAKLFWCNTSDKIEGKATYAATILENIKNLFNCSDRMEKKIEKKSKALAKFEPPLLIAASGGMIGGGIIGIMGLFVWFPIRCILWGFFSIFCVGNLINTVDTFLMKCAINTGMALIMSLPIWLTLLILLDIISCNTIFVILVWIVFAGIDFLVTNEKRKDGQTNN